MNYKRVITVGALAYLGHFLYRKAMAANLVFVTANAAPKSVALAGDNRNILIKQPFAVSNTSLERLVFNKVGGAIYAKGVQVGTYVYDKFTDLPANSTITIDVLIYLDGPAVLQSIPTLLSSSKAYKFDLSYDIQVGVLRFADSVPYTIPSIQSLLAPFISIFTKKEACAACG